MRIVVSGIRLPLEQPSESAVDKALHKLSLRASDVQSSALRRVSYDARKGEVSMVCSVLLELKSEKLARKLCEKNENVRLYEKKAFEPVVGSEELRSRPVVAGFGPAGMFAALALARYGYHPLVLERGDCLEARVRAVDAFFSGGQLDERTNVQFGEGGAGTFSDGKLTSRINDPLCDFVLDTFVEMGAPRDILTRAKPHVGTDMLRSVVRGIRGEIIRLGGEVRFLCPLRDLRTSGGALSAVQTDQGEIETQALVLACGHSARDTFSMLGSRGLPLLAKPFSVGMRIEHLQCDVDRMVYGAHAGDPRLPRAEYALSERFGSRAVYTFCMCPGGTVVAAASESGGVVSNGMSVYARDGKNANSALVVSVDERDFGSSPFDAIEFQRKLERAAYAAGGGGYRAPAQSLGNFLSSKTGIDGCSVEPSYPRGITEYELGSLFSEPLATALRDGATALGRRLRGFDSPSALLTGVETRTSSPVRIPRGETLESTGCAGVYPCGEGAGYAGGIMSAAVDGLRVAGAIIERYKPN